MSFSELEMLYHLCELDSTQVLQSLALALLKTPYAEYYLSGNQSSNQTSKDIYQAIKLLKMKNVTNESLYSI